MLDFLRLGLSFLIILVVCLSNGSTGSVRDKHILRACEKNRLEDAVPLATPLIS